MQYNTITGLFNTDAADWLYEAENSKEEALSFPTAIERPVLPVEEPAPETERSAYWRSLRTFFQTGKVGTEPSPATYPALLFPFREGNFIQRDYPCWISETSSGDLTFFTLPDFLKSQVDQLASEEEQVGILQDNLLRLEGIIREKLSFVDDAFKATPVVREALQELEQQLSIQGKEGRSFSDLIKRLSRQLSKDGVLIPFSPNASFHILATVIQRQLKQKRNSFREKITQTINQLKAILAVEQEKSPEAHSPEQLHSTMEFAGDFLNFEALSSVLPSGALQQMPEERHKRIERLVETLEQAEELLFGQEAFVVTAEEGRTDRQLDWSNSYPSFAVIAVSRGRLSKTLNDTFDEVMNNAARVFAALRLGTIEAAHGYTPELHADFFAHFNWHYFDDEELAVCAPVILLEDVQHLIEKELDDFSRLLASNRPVKLFVEQSGRDPVDLENLVFRQELGALAIAHRNTFVLQAATAQPRYLHEGFTRGLRAAAPALFYLLSPLAGKDSSGSPDLWMSAAVEGREFPGFLFDSQSGPKWGNRFDIHNNPEPEADWPLHQLPVIDQGEENVLELPFTFADFAAQDRRFNPYFQLVAPAYWTKDLVPLSEYLNDGGEAMLTTVPYIWVMDEHNTLQRAAVAWPLVQLCQERLDFWHYLQENAGVHNYHVEQATDQLKAQLEAAAAEKIKSLEEAFAKELEAAKEEAARSAIENLASVLLEMDVEALAISSPAEPVTNKKSADTEVGSEIPSEDPEEEAITEVVVEEEEQVLTLGDAWIDTPLCTSCNECIDTNSKIFQYNGDKQAFVADPKGGPFADIVKAAENCPVRIIHPGAPQHPNEAHVEELVKRAEPFQ